MAIMWRKDDDISAEEQLGENRGGITVHGAGIHLLSGNYPVHTMRCVFSEMSWVNMERE